MSTWDTRFIDTIHPKTDVVTQVCIVKCLADIMPDFPHISDPFVDVVLHRHTGFLVVKPDRITGSDVGSLALPQHSVKQWQR